MYIALIHYMNPSGFVDMFPLNKDGYVDRPETLDRPIDKYMLLTLEEVPDFLNSYFYHIIFYKISNGIIDFTKDIKDRTYYNIGEVYNIIDKSQCVGKIRIVEGYYKEIENRDDILDKVMLLQLYDKVVGSNGINRIVNDIHKDI
jgi:hypothetical protein